MTPKTQPQRRTQAERTDEARSSLIDAAVDLIAERGLAGVTLSDVGARAGYSRGLAVYHFGSKAGLILAVFDHVRAVGARAMAHFATGPATANGKLLSLFDAIADTAAKAPTLYRATTALLIDGAMSPEPEIRHRTQEAELQALASMVALVETTDIPAKVDKHALARAILNTVYGVQMRAFMMGGQLDVAQEMRDLKVLAEVFLERSKA